MLRGGAIFRYSSPSRGDKFRTLLPLEGEDEGGGDPNLKGKNVDLAKNLRKRSTDAERLMWKHLRVKQMGGLKFRRQHPIGNYIVDFACLEKRVVVELDGGQHGERVNKDRARDEWLKARGYKVLRFWNNEVLKNVEGVLEVIMEAASKPPSPNPSLKGGEN